LIQNSDGKRGPVLRLRRPLVSNVHCSRAQRKREFAADMGLQAHVLRMAAEGAVSAYEDIIGETWKP
jgi:hypothetical protein